jgi:adenine-specific DNA methylase
LDDERTDPDPKPRSANFFSKAGKKGSNEEKSANEQQDVAVPFEVARTPDKEKGE